jgi:hypothetical protein
MGWSEWKRKYNYSKMAAKLKEKRTSISMVQDQYLSFATFQTPLVSHSSLPFITWKLCPWFDAELLGRYPCFTVKLTWEVPHNLKILISNTNILVHYKEN